ncbi:MAG: hypothetical protein COB49_03025 [Alphaproteobacteria bacterium]|nr:MAG: hypothetical protein COB49_03025 [Alphaproteobacteria bacterium]
MKLRIDPEKISFRLDFDELELLLDKGEIQEITKLPKGRLTYKVICLPAGGTARFQAEGSACILSLPQNVIKGHKAALPSLKGITTEFDGQNGSKIKVALEVNLKKKLKHSLE